MKHFFLPVYMMLVSAFAVSAQKLTWGQLPQIPDKFGFAGAFSGVSGNVLIVVGGANFPDGGAPWTGSKKAWSNKIFILDKPTGHWQVAGHLPHALGYGVSINYQNKLICIGGSNERGHRAEVLAISYHNGKVNIESLPALPQPLANSCGVLIGHTIYIAGGLLEPNATSAAKIFYSLNLAEPIKGWHELQAWPGPPRMLSVVGTYKGSFYLFSGTDLEDKAGTAHRKYLTDAYCYTPGVGWKKLADMPGAVVAAPGPAFNSNNSLLVFGGDDGKLADRASTLKEKHPGFSTHILSYNTRTNSWKQMGVIKTDKKADVATNPNGSIWAPVTTNAVLWHNMLIFPGGEVRPAIRTPRVLTLSVN